MSVSRSQLHSDPIESKFGEFTISFPGHDKDPGWKHPSTIVFLAQYPILEHIVGKGKTRSPARGPSDSDKLSSGESDLCLNSLCCLALVSPYDLP